MKPLYQIEELPEVVEQFINNACNAHEFREDVILSFHRGYPVAVKSMVQKHRLDDFRKNCTARFDLDPIKNLI